MILKDSPDVRFAYKRNLSAEDALAFIAQLEALDASTAVGYLSGKLEATRGIWVRVGSYRLANDSFIDPSDLMLYVASYYEPDADGPIGALELNHGSDAPEGAFCAATLDELLDALVLLDYREEQESEEGGEGKADEAGEAGETSPELAADEAGEVAVMSGRLDGMAIIEPAAAPEMRGVLVKGWHAMHYEAADGSSLLVFD